MLLAVRMGRFLSGPGCPPIPGLVPAYLALLEELGQDAEGDLAPVALSLARPLPLTLRKVDTKASLIAMQQPYCRWSIPQLKPFLGTPPAMWDLGKLYFIPDSRLYQGVVFSAGEAEYVSKQKTDRGRSTCPKHLLSKLLLAFLDAGDMCFGQLPGDASSARRLIRLVLAGMPGAETACMASAGTIGLCQVSLMVLCSQEQGITCLYHGQCSGLEQTSQKLMCL